MRVAVTSCLLAAFSMFAMGCNPTCPDTCRRFYDETQCNAAPDGFSADDAIATCTKICQDALQVTGPDVDIDSSKGRAFDPSRIAPLNESITLENERDAAAWMDCVASFSDDECSLLDQQYCVKIF
jgi:hypothetical protein